MRGRAHPTARSIAGALALALGAACGCGAPEATSPDPGEPPPETPGSCTGPVPASAVACPGSGAGLAHDAPRVLVASCVCAPPCSVAPCAYFCDAGHSLRAGACVADGTGDVELVDNGDGTVTVTDPLGRLVWLKDANCTEPQGGVSREDGRASWWDANLWVSGLGSGACGLRDGSAAGAWRLPNKAELAHLMLDLGADSPFTHVQAEPYWSNYWLDDMCTAVQGGTFTEYPADTPLFVWPVR
jgi:hypothetical protein